MRINPSAFVGALIGSAFQRAINNLIHRFVKTLGVVLLVAVGLFIAWWKNSGRAEHAFALLLFLALLLAWIQLVFNSHKIMKPPVLRLVPDEPKQVLYRWWEPSDLPLGTRCFCGKKRVPGQLVYVGITGAHRSRELDEDRRSACWWQPGIQGTTELFNTRRQVEDAEQRAIETEHPRENKVSNHR